MPDTREEQWSRQAIAILNGQLVGATPGSTISIFSTDEVVNIEECRHHLEDYYGNAELDNRTIIVTYNPGSIMTEHTRSERMTNS